MTIYIMFLSVINGTKDITISDKIFFTIALLAIVPWYLTKDPTLSIVIVTIINMLAFFPTIRKTIKDITSETFIFYSLNFIRHCLSIIALEKYNVATVLYPASLILMNGIMTIVMLKPRMGKI